jgi:hypothetical protein
MTDPTMVEVLAALECLAVAEEVWDAVFADTDFEGDLEVGVAPKVDDGNEPVRHVLSVEGPTVSTFELPP